MALVRVTGLPDSAIRPGSFWDISGRWARQRAHRSSLESLAAALPAVINAQSPVGCVNVAVDLRTVPLARFLESAAITVELVGVHNGAWLTTVWKKLEEAVENCVRQWLCLSSDYPVKVYFIESKRM